MKKYFSIILFLVFLVGVLYLPFLNNTFIADDDLGIALNKNITNLSVIFSDPLHFFRPFLYYIAYKLGGGLNPIFFRLTNIIFHLGTTLLIFFFFLKVSTKKIALATASIFAVHPILIESVTWISGGSYSLYSFFLMLSLMLYVHARQVNKIKYMFFSMLAFLMSLLSSEKAVVLPLIIILYEYSFSKNKLFSKKNIVILTPFFILSLIIGALAVASLGSRTLTFTKDYYQNISGYDPRFQIPVAISYYLQLIFFPAILTLYHSEVITDPEYITRVVVCVLFFLVLLISFQKNKNIFFGLGFFLLTILPVLNPFGISSLFAERYVYLGSVGIIFVAVYSATAFFNKSKLKNAEVMFLAAVLIILGIRTVIRNIDWRTHENFWIATTASSPYSFQAHYNLATVYVRSGKYKKAIEEYNKTIVLAPKYADVYQDAAAAYHNLKDIRTALGYYLKALELNPKLWKSAQNIGGIYFQAGQLDTARTYTIQALAVKPDEVNLYINLGIIELRRGNKKDSKASFEKALKLDPQNKMAMTGLLKLEKTP